MTPFPVDPSWYEQYWLRERPAPQRGRLLRGLITAARQAARTVRPTRAARPLAGATMTAACVAIGPGAPGRRRDWARNGL